MDHGRGPLCMVRVHGSTPMVGLFEKISFENLGPLTRCKPNVDQENDHAPKSECANFFLNTCPKRAVLKNIQV